MTGVGYGLLQWTYPSRKQTLYSAVQSAGKDVSISDVDVQISVMLYEISAWSDSDKATWEQATDVETAAKAYCDGMENPTDPDYTERAEMAEYYLELYGSD